MNAKISRERERKSRGASSIISVAGGKQWSMPLCPPEKFGIVEAGLFRSDIPSSINFSFLKTLQLKTALYLSREPPPPEATIFFEEEGIEMVNIGGPSWVPSLARSSSLGSSLTEEFAKKALEIVLNEDVHPLLVLCSSGVYETGTLFGCLRRLQCWALTAILHEYRSFARAKARGENEQFIELFDTDMVTLPSRPPQWFLLGVAQWLEEEENHIQLRHTGVNDDSCPSGAYNAGSSRDPRAQLLYSSRSSLTTNGDICIGRVERS